jgi:hypothetical protein
MKNRVAVISLAVGLVGGGVAGLALGVTALAGAASGPTPASNAPASPAPPSGGTARSNEDATHEQGENPAREADENAGRAHMHFGDNENPSHDSTETPQREAQEDARNNSAPSQTTPSSSAPGV